MADTHSTESHPTNPVEEIQLEVFRVASMLRMLQPALDKFEFGATDFESSTRASDVQNIVEMAISRLDSIAANVAELTEELSDA